MSNRPKVKLFAAASVDGYIARANGKTDWLFTDADYGYEEFYAGVETVVMGRVTYEQLLGWGPYPYKEKRGVVFSRKKADAPPDENVSFTNEKPADFVAGLPPESGDVWLVGGGKLVRGFASASLIDEYHLFIHPLVLGSGVPLFWPTQNDPQFLTLIDALPYSNGLVRLSYQRKGAAQIREI